MKICVAVPSISDFYFSIDRMTALGARTVCRLIRSAGHEIVFLDFPNSIRKAKSIPRPVALSHLDQYIISETGPVSFFSGYKRLGPVAVECAQIIAESEPDLLLISCFAYAYAEDTLALANAVHAIMPHLTIVVGGAGATVLPEKFLRSESITFVLSGEAETNLNAFLHEYKKSDPDYIEVPGLFFQAGPRISSPMPRRESREDELEWVHSISGRRTGRERLTTSLSRGCPRNCTFCSNHLCHGRRFRKTPIDKVIAGIDSALTGAGVRYLNLEDDNLFADRDYAIDVIRHARKRPEAPAVIAENGIDFGFLDSGALEEVIDLGLNRLNLSLGTLDSRVLERTNRSPGRDRIAELTSYASARGVESVTYFICGLPLDTRQSIAENLHYLSSLKTTIGISLYYPVPGIGGFEDKAIFADSPAYLCCGSSAFPWTNTLSTKTLVTTFRLARFLNLRKEPRKMQIHGDLVRRAIQERRLYTWRKTGSGHEAIPVPHMDDELVKEVITRCDVDMLERHA